MRVQVELLRGSEILAFYVMNIAHTIDLQITNEMRGQITSMRVSVIREPHEIEPEKQTYFPCCGGGDHD